MTDISIRITGHAGRITLTRPQALNAMTYEMCMAIDTALRAWADDDAVKLVVMNATGERAFCSGGDIAELYDTGTKGDFAYGQRFWADEYRLNNLIHSYGKPVVSFLQGFTMGGGVGIGCHGSYRVVGETSQIAMPECGIGLVPDVGGSLMLAQARGFTGTYLGTTGARMGAADAIYAGFADGFIPQADWPALIAQLEETGGVEVVTAAYTTPEAGVLADQQAEVDALFDGATLSDIRKTLATANTPFASEALKKLDRSSPLSAAYTIQMLHQLRNGPQTMAHALDLEYRFTYRAAEHGDFLEGIRAAIIDKDRNPNWKHRDGSVPEADVQQMLAPLGPNALNLEDTP